VRQRKNAVLPLEISVATSKRARITVECMEQMVSSAESADTKPRIQRETALNTQFTVGRSFGITHSKPKPVPRFSSVPRPRKERAAYQRFTKRCVAA
jgi:hypothetical protein